jgi:hypothetical protein
MKYCIEIREVGVWLSVDVAATWLDALSIASMYAYKHGENAVQITGGAAINEP